MKNSETILSEKRFGNLDYFFILRQYKNSRLASSSNPADMKKPHAYRTGSFFASVFPLGIRTFYRRLP